MPNKKNVRKAHNRNKQAKQLKRKRKLKAKKPVSKNKPKMSFKDFALNYAVENMAKVSFSYLEKGTNFYLENEEVDLTTSQFLIERKADTYFSCGTRGVMSEGDLNVSKPLTWIPESDNPTIKDYLAELWNPEEEGKTQINSFSFFLYDDEDFAEGEYGDHFLAVCVIVSGVSKENINGYLVLREVQEKEGLISLEGDNIFLDFEGVLDMIIPPMINPQVEQESEEEVEIENEQV